MKIKDLYEGYDLRADLQNTLSPTMIIPELINSDAYKQYRYTLALAAARSFAAGEIPFDVESAWNESLAAVAYTPEDLETLELANKMMGVKGVMLSKSKSTEPGDTHIESPVMKFNMFDNMIKEGKEPVDIIRGLMDKVSAEPDES